MKLLEISSKMFSSPTFTKCSHQHVLFNLSPCTFRSGPSRCRALARRSRASMRAVCAASETSRVAEAGSLQDDVPSGSGTSTETNTGPPRSEIWELDFSSRPVLDSRGKKKWELLICSPDGAWKFSKYFPNNKINSTQVCSLIPTVSC